MLILAAAVLGAAAWLRGAEYDEQYTLFLTAGVARPSWPVTVFPAGFVAAMQSGHASLAGISRDLRTTDVHPPLYFWAVSLWREFMGPSLFVARTLSALCGLASLGLVGAIAKRCAIAPALPMLLTLGCYGFVYTNAIARGFAPAQMLTLGGVLLLLERRPLLAGGLFGAACCCNYLAIFVVIAAVAATGAVLPVLSAIPFLAVDAWFLVAQHATRQGQFPAFSIWQSLLRLGRYQIAAAFGGLPLYVDGGARILVTASIGLLAVALAAHIALARPWRAGSAIRVLLAAAMAPPIGLMLLGAAFDNTPIELRYLCFGLPFIALLVAWACRRPFLWPVRRVTVGLALVLALQSAGIAGLVLAPRTMQPARVTAAEAARRVGNGIVLLPRGNDGVGIVGAFGIEAPPSMPVLLLDPADPIAARVSAFRRVVIALMAQDRDSTEALAGVRAALAAPDWRRVAFGSSVEVYERTDRGE
ncbi:MAG TPA: hypothetical protein VGC09_03510 [Rhodopila sp.]